jgi:glycosyltransferase involved in cell wall biosynthesis
MAADTIPVSVVIPAYQREKLLEEALASVAAQAPRQPREVIVVDDCSTDATAEVAERAGARVLSHDRNRGAGAARNTAIAAATQPWIAPLDSDDRWLPHHLDTLWRMRDHHVFVSGAALASGGRPRYAGVPGERPRLLRSPSDVVFPENVVPASGLVIRADDLRAIGGYDTSLPYAEDFDLVIRLLERGTGLALPVVVYRWRRHGGSKSQDATGPTRTHREIVGSYAGRPWWSRALLERRCAVAEWDDLRRSLSAGRRREALGSAAWIVSRPQRLAGLAGLLAFRRRVRRRTSREVRRAY